MSISKVNKIEIISMIREGASIKEISNKLNISISLIYDFLKMTIPSDKSIEFDKLRASTQIRILIMSEDYEGALEICNREDNLNNMNIQEQQVRILLKMFQQTEDNSLLERALVICNNNPSMNNCKKYKNKINNYMKNFDNNYQVTNLLSNICYGNISVEEINNSDIDTFKKLILLISYYEKNNKKKGLSYIKMLKKDYSDDKEKLKILNLLYERLNSKKTRVFDAKIYASYLNCTVDMVNIQNIPEVEKIEIKSKPKVIDKVPEIRKKSVYKSQQVTTVKNIRYNRYNNQSSNKKQTIKSTEPVIRVKKIKEKFPQEILEIGKYLYVEMNNPEKQQLAIAAWDNFECLIEKTTDDLKAMGRIRHIIDEFDSAGIITKSEVVYKSRSKTYKKK